MRWLLIFLACCLCVSGADRRGLLLSKKESSAPSFTAAAAGFDGSDYLTHNGAPTGFADAKTVTFSCWIDRTGGDGTLDFIFFTVNDYLDIYFTTGNKVEIYGENAAGTTILLGTTSVGKVASDGWFHLLITVDLANSSNRHIYFDGVEDASVTWTTYTDDTLNLDHNGSPARRVCAGSGGADSLTGSAAEFWLANRYLNDTTKFRSGGGAPISLGSDGSTPDGTKPGFYFSLGGSGDSWNLDSANGNTFTLTGTLGSPAPPP